MKKITFLLLSFFIFPSFAHQNIKNHYIKHNPWRSVQEKVHNTVVQIFTQISSINLLHPYRSPDQTSCCGSGFFINENGDIVTNAHVVNQAIGICIQIPSLGKRPIRVELVSICPERDLALLRLSKEGKEFMSQVFEKIPFLPLGDSDLVRRSDEVLAIGYPLGQESLKSTAGVVNGMEKGEIQIDAAINPGSSGGPLLNFKGEVIGINSSGIEYTTSGRKVDNISYAKTVNKLKLILDTMYELPLIRKPDLGLVMSFATDELTEYLGNPHPGGCYLVEIVEDKILYKAGLRSGDMIYEVDGYQLDIYGEMSVPWSEDKISIFDYISRMKFGQHMDFVVYRKGEHLDFSIIVTQRDLPAISKVYPGYDYIDYEIFAGMVVMQLTTNHIHLMSKQCPGLLRYMLTEKQNTPVLVITHIFHNSELYFSRIMYPGVTLKEVNGKKVKTLDDFRSAVKEGKKDDFFVLEGSDNASGLTDNLLAVLSMDKIIQQELELAEAYHYVPSLLIQKIIETKRKS